ncbi:acyltransferase [Polaribacter sp. PL03]|uniref:acyltransferase n=1 Tax=Polaribacter sp. PL03 TaxID=3088353 RepID=UPI0029CDF607|nr:acyltransferase [Polaribacter sp. PL03]MDX6745249.1 acyltransferase [Polaribacter sp. PL03]
MYKFFLFFYFIKSKVINYLKFRIFDIKFGKNCKVNGSLFLKGKGSTEIGNNVIINSSYIKNPIGGQTFTSIVVADKGKLKIGNNVGMSNCAIFCSQQIVIKDFVLIGGNCKIYDTDFHSIYLDDRIQVPEIGVKNAKVLIKEGAFIGASSIILKGVEIGKKAVVAAGSVVSKNIPDNEVWGGNPAKFIKKIEN